eukprot:scaffold67606_cov67-Phaeocystis_antarctica.AAC.3
MADIVRRLCSRRTPRARAAACSTTTAAMTVRFRHLAAVPRPAACNVALARRRRFRCCRDTTARVFACIPMAAVIQFSRRWRAELARTAV